MMSEFNAFLSFLHEKGQEDAEIKTLCKAISEKYLENKKQQLHDAREENIFLKIDVANLESVNEVKMSSDEALIEVEALLMELDKEHFKGALDLDYVIEKLGNYEKIKTELDNRSAADVYQQLYERKLNMAKKLDERHVVKEYRQKEIERANTQKERLCLEEKVKEKEAEIRNMADEINETILKLVQGSKDIEAWHSHQASDEGKMATESEPLTEESVQSKSYIPKEKFQPKGLSSRLQLVFNEFKVPHAVDLPKVKASSQARACNLLLRQADTLQKSIQSCTSSLSASSKLQSILKNPIKDTTKGSKGIVDGKQNTENELSSPGCSSSKRSRETLLPEPDPFVEVEPKKQKTETNFPKQESSKTEEQEVELSCLIPSREATFECSTKNFMNVFLQFSKDTPVTVPSSPEPETKAKPEKQKIEVLENIILKPAGSTPPFPIRPRHNDSSISNDRNPSNKRKRETEDEPSCSVPKKSREKPPQVDSKSFVDVFTDVSKGTSITSLFPVNSDNNAIEVKEMDETPKKPKSRKIVSFDDFDDFFEGFANTGAGTSENSDNPAEVSFSFMEANENSDDADNDPSAFQL